MSYIALLLGIALLGQTEGAKPYLNVQMDLEKSIYKQDEPILLRIIIRNDNESSVEFRGSLADFLSIHVETGEDVVLESNPAPIVKHYIDRYSRMRIVMMQFPPLTSREIFIGLSDWFDQRFTPGKYKVVASIDSDKALEFAFTKIVPLSATFLFEVAEERLNQEEVDALLEGCNDKIGWPQSLDDAKCVTIAVNTLSPMLANQKKDWIIALQDGYISHFVIESLRKTGSVEAAKALVDAVEINDGAHFNMDLLGRAMCIQYIYELRKSCDKEILEATEAFVQTHPCPKCLPRRDKLPFG